MGGMTRSLAHAVLIQGVGAVVAIFTVFGISRFLGADAQGAFAIYKNWLEVASMVLLVGIPQGVIYVVNKGHAAAWFLVRLSLKFALVSAPLSFAATLWAMSVGYLPGETSVLAALGIALGCSGYVFHGLVRGIYLTIEDGARFSSLTVLPTLGLALIVAGQAALGIVDMALLFTINGLICGTIAWFTIHPVVDRSTRHRTKGWLSLLLSQSAHSFLISIVLVLQPLAVFALIQLLGGEARDIGIFSLALIGLTAVNAMIAMIAPILYNRWSKASAAPPLSLLRGRLALSGAVSGLALGAALAGAAPLIVSIAGPEFEPAREAIIILASACIPLVLSRLWLPALLAQGRPQLATISSLLRPLVAVGALAAMVEGGSHVVLAAAIGWSAAEWVSAVALYLLMLRGDAQAAIGAANDPASGLTFDGS